MDLKAELENFKPVNLDELVQDEEKIPDNIRNSIFLYNKAIESLRSGSEDIAVIGLKKATSMNPNFNEAFNLLGICYSYIGETEKAAEAFNRVIKAESNSILAMNIMQRLGMGGMSQTAQPQQKARPVRKSPEQPEQPLKRIREAKSQEINLKKTAIPNIVKIGAGFIAGLIVCGAVYLALPKPANIEPGTDNPGTNVTADDGKQQYEAQLSELQQKNDLLEKDKETAIKQADYYKAAVKLYEVEGLVRDRKYENAADMLLLMKTIEFKDTEKEKFDSLFAAVMPLAAKSVYDQGYRFYNQRKYEDALKNLEKVQIYDPRYRRMDAALYYMGRSCQFLQDSRGALAMFQKLVAGYPDSTYTRNAKIRIDELTKIP
ncbi:MAG TPA: tetratricopeptide repeat protein [Clostridia bacterium]|nr:tetratricopeptide repeat protein [Clostridia bacterium]